MSTRVSIPEFSCGDPPASIADALAKAGCAVIHDILSVDDVELVKSQLAPFMAEVEAGDKDDPEAFYPVKTKRIAALMARSKASHAMALNPLVAELCNIHLGDNCERFQLHVSAALEIGPGAREQILHREEDPFGFFTPPRPNMVLATMWAISDFKKENGATLLVPGSHRWPADRRATEQEIISAEMPKGSMLVWLGGTLHAAGANVSNDWRYGIILTYSLGWLRQEENQYLDLPADIAAAMPKEIKALMGYTMHGALGFYDPGMNSM